MATKKITQIAAIASECCNDKTHVLVPNDWRKKRVFAILKEQQDQFNREQERKNTVQIGVFASALVESGKKCKS